MVALEEGWEEGRGVLAAVGAVGKWTGPVHAVWCSCRWAIMHG